jgi:hypothetical protein
MKQMTYLLHLESHASARKDHAIQIRGSSQVSIPGNQIDFPRQIIQRKVFYLILSAVNRQVGELYLNIALELHHT